MKALLSISEAARHLGLSVDTVRELERSGQIRATRTPGGHRRFAPAALDAWVARHSARPTRGRQEAPAFAPSSHSTRTRPALEEPPGEPWDEPAAVERPRPAAPAANALHEQVLEELKQATEERAERNRIRGLKSYGQSLIPFGATASARSAVIEALESYVTASRFPPASGHWEAWEAIRARVEAILEPFNEAATWRAQAEARRAEQERDEQQVRALIERGKSRAALKTAHWDWQDARDARADVLDALEDEVEGDWTDRHVENLVDGVLDEWDDESGET